MTKTPRQDAIFGAMPGTNIEIQRATGYTRAVISHFILLHRKQVFISRWVPVGDHSVPIAQVYARGSEPDAPRTPRGPLAVTDGPPVAPCFYRVSSIFAAGVRAPSAIKIGAIS